MQVNTTTLEFENLTNDEVYYLLRSDQSFRDARDAATDAWFVALGTPSSFDRTVGMFNLLYHSTALPRLAMAVAKWIVDNGWPTTPEPPEEPEE